MPPEIASTSATQSGPKTRYKISLSGIVRLSEYHIAKELLTGLQQYCKDRGTNEVTLVSTTPYFDFEYKDACLSSKNEAGNLVEPLFPSTYTVIETHVDQSITREYVNLEMLVTWSRRVFPGFSAVFKTEDEYTSIAQAEFQAKLATIKNPIVHMSLKLDGQNVPGKLYIELYQDTCPETVKHFLSFIQKAKPADEPKKPIESIKEETEPVQVQEGTPGENKEADATQEVAPGKETEDGKPFAPNYIGTKFLRLVSDGWIQGGDPSTNLSITSPVLVDENYVVRHDTRGTISMVNRGPNTNVSSFMFLLASKMEYFDGKYVAFGRIRDGDTLLQGLESLETRFERIVSDVSVADIGVL